MSQRNCVTFHHMANFLVEFLKLTLVAITVLALFGIAFVYLEGEHYDHPQKIDEEKMRAWLDELEPASDKDFRADTLQEICESKNSVDDGWCTGYMIGFVEGHATAIRSLFCIDDEFSKDQAFQSFKNYMEDNPQYWGKSRSIILAESLRQVFDCKDSDGN
ncbi:hypothetical protein RA25_13685 [Leisingera sp. ANG-S5]|nr:hypothetical protein RA25_13685 [Leisingera sp. ANG-S5]